MRTSLLLALSGLFVCAGCASKVDAPPIIASPPPPMPNAQTVEPVDGSTCVTYNVSALCARWVRDERGNLKLEIMRVKR